MGTTYGEVFVRNLRAARARADLAQPDLALRMTRLGFTTWTPSKVSKAERNVTPVTLAELLALAVALETTIAQLTAALPEDEEIEFPSGDVIGAVSVRNSALGMPDHAVRWTDDHYPSITRPGNAYSARAQDRTLMSA